MPDKANVNDNSSKSNISSLNASHTPIQPKSELQLNERDQKLATLQKMADNSPYSQRFAHLTSLAKNSIQKQPVSQLSKDSHSLPDNVKQGVESLSGISMDDVKVHYNSDKPAQLNAHAYAQGTDIHIASGQEKHLPHEAWHVVQQKQGRVQPTTMMKAKVFINDDQGLEKEADVMGARALQMKPYSLSDYTTEKSVQRKEIIQREVPKTRSRSEGGKGLPLPIPEESSNKVASSPVNEFDNNDFLEFVDGKKIAAELAKNAAEKGLNYNAPIASSVDIAEMVPNINGDKVLKDKIEKAGVVGKLQDAVSIFKKITELIEKDEVTAFDMLNLTMNIAKFSTSFIDFPGLKDVFDAVEQGSKAFQTYLQYRDLNKLVEIDFQENEDKAIIEKYRVATRNNLILKTVDFTFSAATAAALLANPAVGAAVKMFKETYELFKIGVVAWIDYKDKRDERRAERIGDVDVKDLKKDNILEKSNLPSFRNAKKIYSKLKKYESEEPKTKDEQDEKDELDKQLKNIIWQMNESPILKEKYEITIENLDAFLKMEQETINKIADEVKNRGSVYNWLEKKHTIIPLLKEQGILSNDEISLQDIAKLDTNNEDYFYEKTQMAIKSRIEESYITPEKMLKNIENLLINKATPALKQFMITEYKGEDAYQDGVKIEDAYQSSVETFLKEMKHV